MSARGGDEQLTVSSSRLANVPCAVIVSKAACLVKRLRRQLDVRVRAASLGIQRSLVWSHGEAEDLVAASKDNSLPEQLPCGEHGRSVRCSRHAEASFPVALARPSLPSAKKALPAPAAGYRKHTGTPPSHTMGASYRASMAMVEPESSKRRLARQRRRLELLQHPRLPPRP